MRALFMVCLQRLTARWGSVEALLTPSLFCHSPQCGYRENVKKGEFSIVCPPRSERGGMSSGPDDVYLSFHELLIPARALRACSVYLFAKEGVTPHLVFDLPDRVNHGRVVATSEKFSDSHE